jgi:hypothetical protein
LAEACWVVAKGESAIASVNELLSDVDADRRIHLLPLDRATLDLSVTLTSIAEMHDRQIVAAALLLTASSGQAIPLLTRDENITASGVVPVVW